MMASDEPTSLPASGQPGPASRGRPRRWADPRGDISEWLDELPPTAIYIATAAKHLLVTEGFESVTLERVALEANVDRATLRHHFASKAALLHAVWDRLQIDAWDQLVTQTREIPTVRDRLHAYIRGLGALIADPEAGRGMAELAPHGLRDPILRERFALDYGLAERAMLEVTGLAASAHGDEAQYHRLHVAASLVIAVIDGLSYRVALDPTFDLGLAFEMLADMVVFALFGTASESAEEGGE